MLYKLAHIIKDKFSFLWEAIEWGNASLFYMLHKKQLAKVNKYKPKVYHPLGNEQ